MTRTRPITNIPASIHGRLLNLARARGTQLNFLFQSYAAERFLPRLARSPVSDRFTLKAATLFVVCEAGRPSGEPGMWTLSARGIPVRRRYE